MKNSITMALICLCITSCGNSSKQQEMARRQAALEKAKQDSLSKKEAEWQRTIRIFNDSVAIYAWGDAKFGMSKREVMKTKAFSGADRYDDSFSMEYEKVYALKESLHLNIQPSIWIDFGGESKNEVVKVRIEGSADWDDFKDFKEDMMLLVYHFKKKYDAPSFLNEKLSTLHFRDLDELKKGYYMSIARWTIGNGKNGTKCIELSASPYINTSYRYYCEITNSVFPKHPRKKTQKEIDEEEKKAKKAK